MTHLPFIDSTQKEFIVALDRMRLKAVQLFIKLKDTLTADQLRTAIAANMESFVMTELNFKWVEKKGRFDNGESLYLNRIKLGGYGWNSSRSKSDNPDDSINWTGELALPSLSKKTQRLLGAACL